MKMNSNYKMNTIMKKTVLSALVFCAVLLSACQPKGELLFNGKNLDGWELIGDARCSVNPKGVLVTEGGEVRNSYLCTTQEYKDFDLTFEFLQEVDGNTGVFFRGYIDEKGGMHGGEVEMGPHGWNNGGIFSAVNFQKVMVVSDEQDKVLRTGEWNTMHVVMKGSHIQTWLNDVPMADIEDEPLGQLSGRLMLQVGQAPTRVLWRNLRLIKL